MYYFGYGLCGIRVFPAVFVFFFFFFSLATMYRVSAAAPCDITHVRFAADELYLENGADCTLEQVSALSPAALARTENGSGDIFLLRYKFYIKDGSTLRIYGPAAGGAVGQFRLLSNTPYNRDFTFVSADWGTIDIRSTEVLSWNENTNDVDTTPDDIDDDNARRSYINAISRKHPDTGVMTESTLTIRDSEIHHLGYQGSQAYGLSWKTILDGSQSLDVLDELDVFGAVIDSEIHHLHYGFYSFGAFGMKITGNRFFDNNVYGIDPHDDSDFLVISGNEVYNNGKHGIICSKRCNNIEISDNTVYDNGEHGIMLHELVDHSMVTGNISRDNGDSGIALYESNHNIVRNNTLEGNRYGIRLSMGASFNLIEHNVIRDSGSTGIRLFRGNNSTVRDCDGIPRSNTFHHNTISASADLPVRIVDSDKNLFRDNTIDDVLVHISSSRDNMFIANRFSTGDARFKLDNNGETGESSRVYLSGEDDFIIDAESGSKGIVLGN